MNVFVIINEWESEDYGFATFQEIVGGRWFDCEDEAWSHLSDIADEYGMELPSEATGFDIPDQYAIRNQSYYIQELTK